MIALPVNSTPECDTALLQRLRQRDPYALASLYDLYGSRTYTTILRMVHDPGIAEDLVQETFLRVWNSASNYDSTRGAFGGWLWRVARNQALDYLRSAAHRRNTRSFGLPETEDPKLFADLERSIRSFDRAKALDSALNQLTADQRAVIDLAYYEGHSQTEIASQLQRPLGTVKSWTRGALVALRVAFGEVS